MKGLEVIPAREYIAQKLMETRKAKGLTTYEVAEAVGSNQTAIFRMERPEHRLDGILLLKVCRFYGVALDFVAGTYNDEVEEVPAELATVEV